MPRRSVSPAPDLPHPVQDLTRDSVVLDHSLPVPEATELPLDHECPDEVGCPIQQGTATMLAVRLVRFRIEGTQRRESLLDLAAQGAKRMRLLLPQLVIKHAPACLRLKVVRQTLGKANCHLRSPQGHDRGGDSAAILMEKRDTLAQARVSYARRSQSRGNVNQETLLPATELNLTGGLEPHDPFGI